MRQYFSLPHFQHSLCPLSHDKPFPAELHLPEKTRVTSSKLLQLFLQLCRLSARLLQAQEHQEELGMRRARAEGPLGLTTVQRKGNSVGVEAIPLHWHCQEHSGVSQIQGVPGGDTGTGWG